MERFSPKTRRIGERYGCKRAPVVRGTVVLVEVGKPEQADRWRWLVLAAYAQLRLARAIVADARLLWERAQLPRRLTPTRVLRGFATLLAVVGTPAKLPKPCGRSPGRPKESRSEPAKLHPALKTAAEQTQEVRIRLRTHSRSSRMTAPA